MKIFDTSVSIARELNKLNNNKSHRHYAMIFNRNKLLSIGENNMESTSYFAYEIGKRFSAKKIVEFPYDHAEINAISKMWGRTIITKKMDMVSIRLNKFGDILKSDPCESCSAVISGIGFKVIYFDGNVICKN